MSNTMIGTCEICGKENVPLKRKYYYYDIECDCCSPQHFECVDYCKDCTPKPPRKTVVSIRPIEEEKQEVAYSFDMEDYADVYDTVEEVIDEFISTTLWNYYDDKDREKLIFRDDNNNTCIVVDVNTVVPYEDYIPADTIVEKLKEDAYEQYERAEDYLDDIDIELLQEELDKLWKKFKKKQGINAPFYTTKETVPYVVTFKDDEVISYKKL